MSLRRQLGPEIGVNARDLLGDLDRPHAGEQVLDECAASSAPLSVRPVHAVQQFADGMTLIARSSSPIALSTSGLATPRSRSTSRSVSIRMATFPLAARLTRERLESPRRSPSQVVAHSR
jgi:hypothetical protein